MKRRQNKRIFTFWFMKLKILKFLERNYLIILIGVLALILRLYRLVEIPISLHWDEASWGYNAYSILKTGRDEYGKFFPFIFKAFGDYKAPIYVYLTAISIAVFGFGEFAIRFPAALFGVIDVILVYFLVCELFSNLRQKRIVGYLAALVLTFSPWHYDFSHGAWEVNVLAALFLLGLIFFFRAFKKPKLVFFSALFFVSCFYVYNSAKLILPLSALGLLIFYPREVFQKIGFKKIFLAGILVILLVMPVFRATFWGGAGGRLKVMSVFSYKRPAEEATRIALAEKTRVGSLRYQVFNNDFVYFFKGIFERYLNHFSSRFLFFEGDWTDFRHGIPDFGVLNWLDLPLLVLGTFYLLKERIKGQGFLWYFLAIAPLPAALTRDIIQSLRAYFMIYPLAIICAFGIFFFWERIRILGFWRWGGILTLGIGYLFVFLLFADRYFIHAPLVNSEYWQYGYKEAMEFIKDKAGQYSKVVFTDKYGQPYIYYLLYNQYDPRLYQSQAYLIEHPEGDVGRVERVDNIEFRNLYWPQDRFEKGVLYVGATYEIPDQDINPKEARVLKDIYFLDGVLAFRIAETLK